MRSLMAVCVYVCVVNERLNLLRVTSVLHEILTYIPFLVSVFPTPVNKRENAKDVMMCTHYGYSQYEMNSYTTSCTPIRMGVAGVGNTN